MSHAVTLALASGANGNPIAVSASNPVPVTGSFSATTAATATAAAPSYSEGTSNALSMDLAGNLRIGGTISASSSAKATAAAPSYIEGSDNAFSQTLTGDLRTVSKLAAGTALVGKFGIDQTTPGTTNAVAVTNAPTAWSVNSAVKDNGTLRVVIATDQPQLTNALLAAQSGTWTVQPGNTANTTPWLMGHGKTIKTAAISAITADTDLVAAVSTKRIKVIAYALFTTGTTASTLAFKSNGAAGTLLANVMLQSQASAIFGANLAIAAPSFLFATVAGEKLTLDVGNTDPITGFITYFDDDAV